jgi:ribonuclease R
MKHQPGLPSRQQIMDYITNAPSAAGKREIARAFGLQAHDKIMLKAMLKDMTDEGLIDMAPGRAFHKMGGLPKVTVLRVVDVDGAQVWASPEHWEAEGVPKPRVRVVERGRKSALGVGDRILARTEEAGNGHVAHVMKQLAKSTELLLGVVEGEKGTERRWLKPVDKRIRTSTLIADMGEAAIGDLVLAERSGRPPRMTARVSEVLGDPFAPRAFSMIAIHKHGIPDVFPEELLADAERTARLHLASDREDLRHLPIVAIDPADARDHDDAVWAEPIDGGGFRALVAIADVSYYVRPGSALDREARKRGNSCYFPDRVVPMLPENLSAGVCSLKQDEDRAALVCHLTIDAQGKVTGSRFARAVIRVAANIAYEDAQAAVDGVKPHEQLAALQNLWACWGALHKARLARAPLALELPERRVILSPEGKITSIAERVTLDANRLIEDFMIAANVAAAQALEKKQSPVMYRAHEEPARIKLLALKEYIETFDIKFALGQVVKPSTFNAILAKVDDEAIRAQIMEQVLRSQTQAYYTPEHIGHFGLALGSYAHFTSPIRRYADVLVHRALVRSHGLGEGGLTDEEAARMPLIGEAISQLERRAMEAERDTIDRYVASFLSERVGQVLETRITGVTSFGFFATVEGLGGDGLVPAATLGAEYFSHDESTHSLVGQTTGERYTLGDRLELRLAEADPVTGALRFELPEGASHLAYRGDPRDRKARSAAGRKFAKGRRGRPSNIRHQGK